MKHNQYLLLGLIFVGMCLWLVTWSREAVSTPRNLSSQGLTKPSSDLDVNDSSGAESSRSDSSVPDLSSSDSSVPDAAPVASGMAGRKASEPGEQAGDTKIAEVDLTDPASADAFSARLADREQARLRAHRKAEAEGWSAKGEADGIAYELQSIEGTRVKMYRTMNHNAAISSAANEVRDATPFIADGSNILVGVWDAGMIRKTHQEFGGRVVHRDSASDHYHATHVGGTVAAAGVQENAKGMAPNARVDSYDWSSDTLEMSMTGMTESGQTNRIPISNHSYGLIVGWEASFSPIRWYGDYTPGQTNREDAGFGIYDEESQDFDQVAFDAPYFLIFKAAGNDRNDGAPSLATSFQYYSGFSWVTKSYDPTTDPYSDGWDNGGYDTIGFVGNAKNIMTVGSVADAVSGTNRLVSAASLSSFTGFGPCDDGRIKPDLVANGASLYSTYTGSDSAYSTMSGTSMATPNAAGSAALVADVYFRLFGGATMRSSALKGLLLHTADDLGRTGPDYEFGWGLLNTRAAVDLVEALSTFPSSPSGWDDSLSNSNQSDLFTFRWDGQSDIRVTLCWTDPPGPGQSGLDSTNRVLINDLDLRVIDPLGQTNYPFVLDLYNPANTATVGDNEVDNVEQVLISAPTNEGVYTISVEIDSTVSNSPQVYSLWVSGRSLAPVLSHTPLSNTHATNIDYQVELSAVPVSSVDTNASRLWWRISGETNADWYNPLVFETNDLFVSSIPAQEVGAEVEYGFEVVTISGATTYLPNTAPTGYTFSVTPELILSLTGIPEQAGSVTPGYGEHSYARGVELVVSAENSTSPSNGFRYAQRGFQGLGSVPSTGTASMIDLTLETNSTLIWIWEPQWELEQSSQPPDLVSTSSWFDVGATGTTDYATDSLSQSGTLYRFSFWSYEGQRQPDLVQQASNPMTGLDMSTSQTAVAVYTPEDLDEDGDGIQDWWELYYFGSTGIVAGAEDHDGDSWSSLAEFQDGTSPLNSNDFPMPPVITYTPPDAQQLEPIDVSVTAGVTDNYAVASVELRYTLNAAGEVAQPMTEITNGVYEATVPGPLVAGDALSYLLVARDGAGLAVTSGPYGVEVDYAVLGWSPSTFPTLQIRMGSSTNVELMITNSGTMDLHWSASVENLGLEDDMESGTNSWTHSGINDLWHLQSERVYQGQFAWHCGNGVSGVYANGMDASLLTPPIFLGADAELRFVHYVQLETDSGNEAWDGAIVEITTDEGLTFEQIAPSGGYPYVVVENDDSPFYAAQPCFADSGGVWVPEIFPLSAYANQRVQIRFRLGSDLYVTDEGWYIDHVTVTPASGTSAWMSVLVSTGVLATAEVDVLPLFLETDFLESGLDRTATVRIDHDDPSQDSVWVPVTVAPRSSPELAWVSALQVSTQGEGEVRFDLDVSDADGDPLWIRVEVDRGAGWTQAWLKSVSATLGNPDIDNLSMTPLSGVVTDSDGERITNRVSAVWDTQAIQNPVLLASGVLARAFVLDGLYEEEAAFPQGFLVDNEAPLFSGGLTSSSHSVMQWTSNQQVELHWDAASDGTGAGVLGYAAQWSTQGYVTGSAEMAVTSFLSEALSEGTNWWATIEAVDLYGNRSTATGLGPFWIDAEAPMATAAVLTLSTSALGAYSLGTVITGSWSGFLDSGSGLLRYYSSLTNGAGTTDGIVNLGTFEEWVGALDQTNTVFVWAEDAVGRIGEAVSASVLLLSPREDYDGDGIANQDEEVTGHSANNASSVFTLNKDPLTTSNQTAVLAWPTVSNRVYEVQWMDGMGFPVSPSWNSVLNPSLVESNGWTTWSDPEPLPQGPTSRFYRIGVSQ